MQCSSYVRFMPPPFDRTVALACTLGTLRIRWLHVRCACCHATPRPIHLMLTENPALARQTLADTLVRLKCHGCHQRGRLTVHLCETPHGAGPCSGVVRQGWALLLHEAAGPEIEAIAAE